jgi:hypothetical protein
VKMPPQIPNFTMKLPGTLGNKVLQSAIEIIRRAAKEPLF